MKKWSWEVVAYVIDSYAGVEMTETGHGIRQPVRHFLWADEEDEVWIGNSAAFALHLTERFEHFKPARYDYVTINRILIDAGERVHEEVRRTATGGSVGQPPLQPKKARAS